VARRKATGSRRAKGVVLGRTRRRNGHGASRLLFAVAALSFLGLFGAIGGGSAVYWFFARDLPSPTAVAEEQPSSTKIYDRNGELLYEVFDRQEGRRTTVPLGEISPWLIKATIATEDADFYRHSGVNVRGLIRAGWGYLSGGGFSQGGGSSITQQLVKNVLIPEEQRAERSVVRKIREIILAVEIERRYSKEQILEWYLNRINYGNLSYGIEAASNSYFGIAAKDLDLAQASMLVGLPQAPARYSPLTNPQAATSRQEVVLGLMVRNGAITSDQASAALAQELVYRRARFDIKAPHFVQYVRERLEERYGRAVVERGGLRVTTTLDLALQRRAEELALANTDRLKAQQAQNTALVALRPDTGEILAMLGSMDYFNEDIDGQVNMATAERQPGSTFKILTYATAFQKGWTPATMVLDTRMSFPDGLNPPYVPENVDGRFRGPVSVRQALAMSLNIPAVRTLAFAGLDNVLATAHRLGINTLTRRNTYGLSLTLGGGEVTLLDMVYANSVFANRGTMSGTPVTQAQSGFRELDPVAILRVEDGHGRVLEEFRTPQRRQVLDPRHAYLVTSILSDNEARAPFFGANNPLALPGRPVAAKTGTTDDQRDNWTIGFTPDLVVGVWVGNSDNTRMGRGAFGSSMAAPIWNAFMRETLANRPPQPFPEPSGLVRVRVCQPSGLLPTPTCPQTREELFIAGTEPKTFDNLWQTVRLDRSTGRLATSTTPSQNVESRVFLVLPPEAADWARENDVPQPPRDFEAVTVGMGSITSPTTGASVHGDVTVSGTAQAGSFARYLLEYGAGLTPIAWSPIGAPRTQPVVKGSLGVWDTRRLADGVYTLRLTVQDSQRSDVLSLPVTVDNRPPVVQVIYPLTDSTLRIRTGEADAVGVQADVQDNIGVDRVEFFVNGQSLGYTTVYPYNRSWRLVRGQYVVYAVATDTAGNTAQSAPVVVAVQ